MNSELIEVNTTVMNRMEGYAGWLLVMMLGCLSSPSADLTGEVVVPQDSVAKAESQHPRTQPYYVSVTHNISMRDYFSFVDSLADATLHYLTTSLPREYILVNANPWIIDSLRTLDYYSQKKRGVVVYDQATLTILHAGDSLLIPDSLMAAPIINKLTSTVIDVNIPEFRLRVIQQEDTLLVGKVRIGQNKTRYMEYYGKELDLRTPVGEGEIVSVRKHPKYIDPETGEEYIETNRDDGIRTKMPIMPSLTPTINGRVTGSLIHATTNPRSLGKAYSNGCVGTSEPDIWTIYYAAPPGTKVKFRYDLEVLDKRGKVKRLKDIYHIVAAPSLVQ